MSSTKDPAQRTLIETLEDIGESAPEDGLSLGNLRDRLDQSAFGAMLVALSMPVSVPFLYGVPQVVAVPMLALAAQMVIGRHEPWLPSRLAARTISKSGLQQMARGARKWFGWVERLAYPRLTFLASRPAERLIGVFLLVFCASILVPLPATNTVPGIAVAIVGFGLLAKDGLLILPGLALGTAWVTGLILVGDRITDVIRQLISGFL
ncbi:MAG: exopolysaccharide biosynthesis protein [Pseudomonadota bacterium]